MKQNSITLRFLKKKDIPGMLEWMHDSKVNQFFRFHAEDMTKEKAEQFVDQSLIDVREKRNFHYAIVNLNDEYLGTISLKNIDWDAGTAEYAISLRVSAQGRGVAREATELVLQIAFEELMLQRVFLNVLEENERAIRLYEKCGFLYEGTFRNHVCIRGKIKSLKWYGMLKEDWRSNGKNNAESP